MIYRILYYRGGQEIGSTPHAGPLAAAEAMAKDGLARHGAEAYRIIDVDGSTAEVASGRRDA